MTHEQQTERDDSPYFSRLPFQHLLPAKEYYGYFCEAFTFVQCFDFVTILYTKLNETIE